MPLYLDVHNKIDGMAGDALSEDHQKDLQVQHKYGVTYLRYWFETIDVIADRIRPALVSH